VSQLARIPAEADGVFEGGGVKGIAFAGAITVAEEAGVREWKNVAGASAGAIVACLLAVGYRAEDLRRILQETEYRRFADYGFGGIARGLVNSLWMRGLAPGRYFNEWLAERVRESPLARSLGVEELTFGHLVRDDLPPDLSAADARRARYRLRVIASDISSGRMLVLPQDIELFARDKGDRSPRVPDELGVVEGVRMSMGFPYLFAPVRLWSRGETQREHLIVDGGLLSNYPVWLFDSGSGRPPARPTWGFRLHGGSTLGERLPYHSVPMPWWRVKMFRAMFLSATEAWDREQLGRATSVRTVSIPTRSIAVTDFRLSKEDANDLYDWGVEAATDFFGGDRCREYLRAFEASRREGAVS
jgi:NTE family protein